MKKRTKVILGILLVIAAVVVALALWQKDNLAALHNGMTMDPETLQEQLEKERQRFDDTMKEYQVPTKEFTQEEIDQLVTGQMSPEEAARKLLGNSSQPSGNGAGNTASGGQTKPAPSDPMTETEKEIRQQIATMYVLQTAYEGKLAAIVQQAKEEYASGGQNKEQILYGKLGQLTKLEKECDQQVEKVSARLRELLKQAGKDASLADEVQETYQTEKSMKKAYYIQEFQNG